MASHGGSFNTRCPSRFDGFNFSIWKIKMKAFLKSVDRDVFLSLEKEFKEFDHVADPWLENVSKAIEANC